MSMVQVNEKQNSISRGKDVECRLFIPKDTLHELERLVEEVTHEESALALRELIEEDVFLVDRVKRQLIATARWFEGRMLYLTLNYGIVVDYDMSIEHDERGMPALIIRIKNIRKAKPLWKKDVAEAIEEYSMELATRKAMLAKESFEF